MCKDLPSKCLFILGQIQKNKMPTKNDQISEYKISKKICAEIFRLNANLFFIHIKKKKKKIPAKNLKKN